MKPCWEVDSNGNIIEHYMWNDDEIESARQAGKVVVDFPWSDSQTFYQPKYNATSNTWVEGFTTDQILAVVKQRKIGELSLQFNNTVAGGFNSSADGTARTYPLDPASMIKWSGAMSIVDANTSSNSLTVKDINGNQVVVTPNQFKSLATDGFNFFMTQEQHLWSLEANVSACTDVASVNAITWEGN